jgi:Tfp pilus assembly protein PilO
VNKKLWIILTAVACVLILVGGWFLLVSPQRAKVASIKADTESQQSVNQGLQSKLSILQAGAAQVPAQQAQIDKIKQQIPTAPQLPTLIRSVSQAASDAGVTLGTFTPASPTDVVGAAGVSFVALTASVKGGYFALEQFLNNLEQIQRALLVNGVAIDSQGASSSGSSTAGSSTSGSTGSPIVGATSATGCTNVSPDDPCLQMNLQARVFSGAAAPDAPKSTSSPAAPSGTGSPSSSSTNSPN